jgi:hypothetical protein
MSDNCGSYAEAIKPLDEAGGGKSWHWSWYRFTDISNYFCHY